MTGQNARGQKWMKMSKKNYRVQIRVTRDTKTRIVQSVLLCVYYGRCEILIL